MEITRGYKTELKLNNKQVTSCLNHSGSARFTWNWGLDRRRTIYKEEGKKLNAISLHKELNALKNTELNWMYEVSKCAPQEALRNLDKAFNNFFRGTARYPRFKSRKKGIGSFSLTGRIKVFNGSIQLPRLGKLRLKEKDYLPVDKHILGATVSEKAGRWFVSIQVREEIEVPENDGGIAGTDIGIKTLAYVSDGKKFDNPKALKRNERKLERAQRRLSKKKKGSKNREKQKRIVQKIHKRISNIRNDNIHKLTSYLSRTKAFNCVEDLNVRGMLKNRRLSKAISDAGLGEFGRQMKYKCGWYGSELVVADRWFPSSKRCSGCGNVKDEMPLGCRTYVCEECGLRMDRDYNASLNLRHWMIEDIGSIGIPSSFCDTFSKSSVTVSSPETLNAFGEESSGFPGLESETIFDELGIEHHLGNIDLFG